MWLLIPPRVRRRKTCSGNKGRATHARGKRPVRLAVERLEDRVLLDADILGGFAGLRFEDDPRYVPPDTHAAAGPQHIVEVANASVAFFDKATGSRIFLQTLDEFFRPLNASVGKVFDPKVAYDELAQRFIVITLEVDFSRQTSFLLLAVSDDSNPVGSWEMQRINVEDGNGTNWGDYPGLGWDADAIYVTLNMFQWNGGFDHVSIITIDKASVTDGNPGTLTFFDVDRPGTQFFTMQPAVMHEATPGAAMYFVTADFGTSNRIQVTRMTNKLNATPTFQDVSVTVNTYRFPPLADQPGGGRLRTNDTRILNAEWRQNRLVATHNIGIFGDNDAHVRWYELDTSGPGVTLVQQGTLDPGPGIDTWMPAIAINTQMAIGLVYMQSSTNEFMSVYVTARTIADPLGTMQNPVRVKAGEATYVSSLYRTGDYSGLTVDPVDGVSFWGASEYATSSSWTNWGTWIAHFSTCTPNNPPTLIDDNVTVPEDSILTFDPTSNDSDPDGDVLTIVRVTQPANGSVTIINNGRGLRYQPRPNFNGVDTFLYTVDDGHCNQLTAQVRVTVSPVNDVPIAAAYRFEVTEDTPLVVAAPGLLRNAVDVDGDTLTAVPVTLPRFGRLTVQPNGAFTYTPDPDFFGDDSFTYQVFDGQVYSNVATVQLVVNGVNDPPVARDDVYTVRSGGSITVPTVAGLLANDTDADRFQSLSVALLTFPAHGTLNLNADGSFNYIPEPTFEGRDSFTYRAFDGEAFSNIATVSFDVVRFASFLGNNVTVGAGPIAGIARRDNLVFVNRDNSDSFLGTEAILTWDYLQQRAVAQVFNTGQFIGWFDSNDRTLVGDLEGDGKVELIQFNFPSPNEKPEPANGFYRIVDPLTGRVLKQVGYADPMPGSSLTYQQVFQGLTDDKDAVFLGHFTQRRNLEALFFNRSSQKRNTIALRVLDLVTGQSTFSSLHDGNIFGGWLDDTDEAFVTDTNNDGFDDLVLVNRVANAVDFRGSAKGFIGMISIATLPGTPPGPYRGFYRFFAWNAGFGTFTGFDDLQDRAIGGMVFNNGRPTPVIVLVNSQPELDFNGRPIGAAFAVLEPKPPQPGLPDQFQLLSTILHDGRPAYASPVFYTGFFDPNDLYLMADVDGDGSQDLVVFNRQVGQQNLRAYNALSGLVIGLSVSGTRGFAQGRSAPAAGSGTDTTLAYAAVKGLVETSMLSNTGARGRAAAASERSWPAIGSRDTGTLWQRPADGIGTPIVRRQRDSLFAAWSEDELLTWDEEILAALTGGV